MVRLEKIVVELKPADRRLLRRLVDVLDRAYPKPQYPVSGERVRLTEPVDHGGVPTETSPTVLGRLLGSVPRPVVDSGYHQELAAFWLAKHAEAERGVGGGGDAA